MTRSSEPSGGGRTGTPQRGVPTRTSLLPPDLVAYSLTLSEPAILPSFLSFPGLPSRDT